ncbi:hypothetical protein JTB14_000258 [Gonioctena quinquepunctata]|nr:hypothetical protein JTB14_000258 [Gonioctena quinquepunctata]
MQGPIPKTAQGPSLYPRFPSGIERGEVGAPMEVQSTGRGLRIPINQPTEQANEAVRTPYQQKTDEGNRGKRRPISEPIQLQEKKIDCASH